MGKIKVTQQSRIRLLGYALKTESEKVLKHDKGIIKKRIKKIILKINKKI